MKNPTGHDLTICGVMLDPARLVERTQTYRELIPLCAGWGYNTIFWHFTDDRWSESQGCALRFPSHPELAARFALSEEETRGLVALAAASDMQVIPEVECFGHTGYIRDLHPHLTDLAPGKEFGAISPFAPETRRILEDLLTDTAAIFPAPYIHVGLDETAFGNHPDTQQRIQAGAKKWELFVEHICWLHSVVTGKLGKTMMIWGDHLLPHASSNMGENLDSESYSAEIARNIPKDIIVCDWHYKPSSDFPTLDFFMDHGFRVIACAATRSYGSLFHPAQWCWDNIRDFTAAAWRRSDNPRMFGAMNCVWAPQSDMTGNLLPGIAFGAECQRSREPDPAFLDRFMCETYGLDAAIAKDAADAVRELMRVSPDRLDIIRALPVRESDLGHLPPSTAEAMAAMGEGGRRALARLDAAIPQANTRSEWLEETRFTARCFVEISDRFASLLAIAAGRPPAPGASLPELRARATALADEGRRLWAVHRFADDFECDGGEEPAGCGAMQQRLNHSAKFLTKLEANPALLSKWNATNPN